MHYLTAILSGAGAGLWTALLLPFMAKHIGGEGGFSVAASSWLVCGGAGLALLLTRFMIWASPTRATPARVRIILPWLAVLFLPAVFLLPAGSRLGMSGTMLGPAKHALAAAWVLGVGLFATRLLPPLIEEFRPRRLAAGFGAVMLLLSFSLSTQPPNESDEGDYVAAALALVETGTTRIDRIFLNGRFHAYYFGRIPSSQSWYDQLLARMPEQTDRLSYRMIGYPAALAPFLIAGEAFATPMLRWWLAHLPGLLGYTLLIGAMASLLLDRPRRAAGHVLLATGGMTPLIYFAVNTQPEIWMAAGTAWALLFQQRHLDGRATVLPVTVVTTMLMLLHERMAIVALILFGAIWWRTRERRRFLVIMLTGMIPVVISYAATLQFQLPRSAPHAYGIEGMRFFDAARWFEATRQHLFSGRIGVFTHLPALLLLPLGLRPADFRQTHPHAAIHRLAAAIGAFYFMVMITYPHTFESFPHLRYMVPILPALGLLLAPAAERVMRHAPGKSVIFFLLGLQLARAWPFLAVPQLWRWLI